MLVLCRPLALGFAAIQDPVAYATGSLSVGLRPDLQSGEVGFRPEAGLRRRSEIIKNIAAVAMAVRAPAMALVNNVSTLVNRGDRVDITLADCDDGLTGEVLPASRFYNLTTGAEARSETDRVFRCRFDFATRPHVR